MEFKTIDRGFGAFQKSVSADELLAMCRRAFGATTTVFSTVELGGGLYNNTYRVDIGEPRPVILRVAPEPARQSRIEHEFMRNEHASLPFFASVSTMMPRTLFTDWTHEIVGRDYMWQTMLDGVPAQEGLNAYPKSQWTTFFEQVGGIARTIHKTCGNRFGRVGGPLFNTWSEAVIHFLEDCVADLETAGIEADDVREVLAIASQNRAILDEIKQPHLLHGDLWVPNVMLAVDAEKPTITGILDHDRASWGDPMADWAVFMARKHPAAECAAFWQSYGPEPNSPQDAWRSLVYRACHLAAVRFELKRLGHNEEIVRSYEDLRELLSFLSN